MVTPTDRMNENALEARFALLVRRHGGTSIKIAPVIKGLPDRLVIWPGGVLRLVELKATGGALSPAQRVVHSRLAALGATVTVLTGRDEIDAWVAAQAPARHRSRRA